MRTISGNDAIRRMRMITKLKDGSFEMTHFTANHKTAEAGELRKVTGCRVRASMPKGVTVNNPDHYLCYTDGQSKEPRMCFKKLIRYVAFPPYYETLKVEWFND